MTLTFTGSSDGRLVETYGTLCRYTACSAGNVTTHPNGTGGAVYNEGTLGSFRGTTIQNNSANRGGGVYNKDGEVISRIS